MSIKAEDIAKLRDKTSLPIMEIKSALIEAKGDETVALEILRKRGFSKAEKKSERETKAGLIEAYAHEGRIGVVLEVLSESDFVAKNSDFKEFVHNIALHIAAMNPKYISEKDIPASEVEKEKSIYFEQIKNEGKPKEIQEKIVEGKLKKYFEEVCLFDQVYIKDDKIKISDLLAQTIAKIGENIVISRFSRFELGK